MEALWTFRSYSTPDSAPRNSALVFPPSRVCSGRNHKVAPPRGAAAPRWARVSFHFPVPRVPHQHDSGAAIITQGITLLGAGGYCCYCITTLVGGCPDLLRPSDTNIFFPKLI
jgi:hypothetical protein